jgi:CubicO group peptidase (beta-lactamase class C family)
MRLATTGVCLIIGVLLVGCSSSESKDERPGFRTIEPTATVVLLTPAPTARRSPTATVVSAQPEEAPPALSISERVQVEVDELLQRGIDPSSGTSFFTGQGIPGTILIGVGDEIVLQAANGLADRENDAAHALTTRFPLGRIVELFIATLALQLHEMGVLDLDSPIGDYLPDFPHGSATIAQLLDRTSALPRIVRTDIEASANQDGAVAAAVEFIAGKTTRFEPGDHVNFLDSSYERIDESDYIVLRYLIEQVTGSTFEELLEENVLERAGMDGTSFVSADSTAEHGAVGYTAGFDLSASEIRRQFVAMDFEPIDAAKRQIAIVEDGTALWATAEDIFQWYRALVGGDLVDGELVTRMFEPGLDLNITSSGNTAYGWFVYEGFLRKQAWAYAESEGYSVGIAASPDQDVFIVVLTNIEEHFTVNRYIPPSWWLQRFLHNVDEAVRGE